MNIKIARITQEDIQRAINLESQVHSPKTVRNSHGLISAVMRTYRPNFALNKALPRKVRSDIYIPSESKIRILLNVFSTLCNTKCNTQKNNP